MHSAIVLALNMVARCGLVEHCWREVLLPLRVVAEWSGVERRHRVEPMRLMPVPGAAPSFRMFRDILTLGAPLRITLREQAHASE